MFPSTLTMSEVDALDTHDPVILALQCAWVDAEPTREAIRSKLLESLGGNDDLCRRLVADACALYMCWHNAERLQSMLDRGERERVRISEKCWARQSVNTMRRKRNEYERDVSALVMHMIALTDM